MDENRPTVERPWWVRAALWGLPNRASAMAFVWLSLALAALAAFSGYWDRRYSVGAILVQRTGTAIKGMATAQLENLVLLAVVLLAVAAALGYLVAVRWVDRHGNWS
jgi:hypothetical protein